MGRTGFVVEKSMYNVWSHGQPAGSRYRKTEVLLPLPQLEQCVSPACCKPGQKLLVRCTLMSSNSFMFTKGNPRF